MNPIFNPFISRISFSFKIPTAVILYFLSKLIVEKKASSPCYMIWLFATDSTLKYEFFNPSIECISALKTLASIPLLFV